jgi:hypothetical protein
VRGAGERHAVERGGERVKGVGKYVALALALCASSSCGTAGDPVVTAEVTSGTKMPFHGPGGPGSEPVSITFMWTVVVKSSEGPDCQVDRIATELSEPESRTVLTVETEPHESGTLPGGGTVQFPQQQGGFFDSALYPRPWNGRTRVDVTCPSRRTDQIEVAFVIP